MTAALLELIVAASATATAGAAMFAARYVRGARTDAGKAVRLLEGEADQPGVLGRLDAVEADVETLDDDVEHLATTVDILATDGGGGQ